MNPYDQAPRPGSIPLRPLAVSEIISASMSVMRRQSLLVFPMAIVAGGIQTIAGLVAEAAALTGRANEKSAADVITAFQGTRSDIVITAVIGTVVAALLSSALALVTAEDVVGRAITGGQLWRRLRPRLGRVVAVSAVVSVAPVIGLILLVPGVWLWVTWAVALPALVIERMSFRRALSRSRELVRGQFWRVFGIRSLLVIGSAVAGGVVGALFSGVAIAINHGRFFTSGAAGTTIHLPVSYLIISALGSWLGAVFTQPFIAISTTVLYVDLRMRKEGLAEALQRAAAMNPGSIG